MKRALVATLAVGAFAGAFAAEGGNEEPGFPLASLNALFDPTNDQIKWESFSPSALGMNLNFSEMTEEELRDVAESFAKLGLVGTEEVEDLMSALLDPRMRAMLESVQENWPATMKKVLGDPRYAEFLSKFQDGFNTEALAKIVGLRTDIRTQLEEVRNKEN